MRLLRPTDADYDTARRVFYSQYDVTLPQAVAQCASASDVQEALGFAHEHDLPVAIRSGGHSPGGYSTGPGLVVDVGPIDHVVVGDTVRVGPGARQIDTLEALAPHGLALPAGICPSVRAGGFVAGGGFGFTTRSLGMACDHLASAEVVLADGRVVRCSETEEPDLFWALRGAGSGNFGVVTEYELRPRPLTTMVNYTLTWPRAAAPGVIAAWQHLVETGPDELGAALGISDGVMANGTFLGDQAELETLLEVFPEGTQKIGTLPYAEAMRQWFAPADVPSQNWQVDRSRMIGTPIPAAGIDELLAAFDAGEHPGRFLGFFGLGGEANRVPRTATAYVHRTSLFYLGFSVGAVGDEPLTEEDRTWCDAGFAVADRWSNGESYQNFIDPDLKDWQQAYFAENLPRLLEIKSRYDPGGFFRYAQSV